MLLIIVKVMFTTSRARKKSKTSFKFRSKLTKAKREMVRNREKLHKVLFIENLVENFESDTIKIFAEIVVRGNSMQIVQVFPPKVLVYIRKNFSSHLLIK